MWMNIHIDKIGCIYIYYQFSQILSDSNKVFLNERCYNNLHLTTNQPITWDGDCEYDFTLVSATLFCWFCINKNTHCADVWGSMASRLPKICC